MAAGRFTVRELTEQRAATRYTARWHRVAAWAVSVLPGDVEQRPSRNPRIAIVRGQWVADLADEEEAESQAMDLGALELFPLGPYGDEHWHAGGRRRVIVRVFTWVVDVQSGVLYDSQWFTTGEGMTARAASAAHNRYIRAYADAVTAGVESRRLKATATEIAWWTAAASRPYV